LYISDHSGGHRKGKMGHRVMKTVPKQPTYGCQVTIQSQQERQLQKMFHKEDKKMMKKDKGAKHIDDLDKESYLAAKGFVPELMRQERCIYIVYVYIFYDIYRVFSPSNFSCLECF